MEYMCCFLLASVIRVFNTSNGVVMPAATAPAILPSKPPSIADICPCFFWDCRCFFNTSQSGNCIVVNGISRVIMIDQPRYSSFCTCHNPRACRWFKIYISAAFALGCWPICTRCLIASAGALTAHAAISPRLAAAICMLASLVSLLAWIQGFSSVL